MKLTVGRLGTFLFPVGRYIYTGSAKRSIEARIARHLRKKKTLRWHIDYLLASPKAKVVSVNPVRPQPWQCQYPRLQSQS